MTNLPLQSRLLSLRNILSSNALEAYIIPSNDPHASEYIAPYHARRDFISGFTGSAGTAVVSLDAAALWTDGRYYLQASKQLSKSWELMKVGLEGTLSIEDWLISKLAPKSTVGIDPLLFSHASATELEAKLKSNGHSLKKISENLVDKVWQDQPLVPIEPVTILGVEFTGQPMADKIKKIQSLVVSEKCDALVINALDEIAWLFSLRGRDISFNPVFHSYALVMPSNVFLYVDDKKLSTQVVSYLAEGNILIKGYNAIFDDLRSLSGKILFDTAASVALVDLVESRKIIPSPIASLKTIKTATEQAGFRSCHQRDAVALCRYFSWLEGRLAAGDQIDEAAGADKLAGFRSELQFFQGLSFDTISSTGPNGAVIHYKPTPGACATIDPDQLYLCDSGGQYNDGTTDVTRTLYFGKGLAPLEWRDAFTRVLKGHIQLDMLVFPKGTTGYIIDCVARMALWRAGLDYRHGTGHGVGHFLNVHEGPQSISFRISSNAVSLKPGMTVTNEPGYYKDGAFGIRIENVMIVQQNPTESGEFYSFEHVTVVPIQTSLIVKELLTLEEVVWINKYHEECWNKISPLLQEYNDAKEWLFNNTRAI